MWSRTNLGFDNASVSKNPFLNGDGNNCDASDYDDSCDESPFLSESPNKTRSMLCGLFDWRPEWLQSLANVYIFSSLVGLSYFFSGLASKSLYGQLVSIERQFNIDSSKSGLFSSASNLGFACSALIVGLFGNFINIPLAIGVSGIICGFVVMIPSLLEIYSAYQLPHMSAVTLTTDHDSPLRADDIYLCESETLNITGHMGGFGEHSGYINVDGHQRHETDTLALYVLLVSLFLQGFVNSFRYGALPYVYVDNNVLDKSRTGVILAITFVLSELTGPVGHLINGYISNIPVDLTDTAMRTDDPRFVSAWWLGVLVFGLMTILAAAPITLLPRHIVPVKSQRKSLELAMAVFAGRQNQAHHNGTNSESSETVIDSFTISTKTWNGYSKIPTDESDITETEFEHQSNVNSDVHISMSDPSTTAVLKALKDTPRSLIRVLHSPLFALLAVEICVVCIPLHGIGPFYIKYIMFEYNVSMAATNTAKGMSSAITHILGTVIGSAMSTRIHTRLGYLHLILVTAFCAGMVTPLIILFGCDNAHVHGLSKLNSGSNTSLLVSSGSCLCSSDHNLLSCGSDTVTYLSPCYAGCKINNGTVFSDCQLSAESNISLVVRPGLCDTGCERHFIYYNIVAAAQTFIYSISNMPRHLLALRILNPDDRALGSALLHFAPIIVSLPAPILFGKWIESTCVVWSSDHCSLYDRDKIRYLVGGVEISVAVITVISYASMICLCRWLDKNNCQRSSRTIH